jgi:hypothetical protein
MGRSSLPARWPRALASVTRPWCASGTGPTWVSWGHGSRLWHHLVASRAALLPFCSPRLRPPPPCPPPLPPALCSVCWLSGGHGRGAGGGKNDPRVTPPESTACLHQVHAAPRRLACVQCGGGPGDGGPAHILARSKAVRGAGDVSSSATLGGAQCVSGQCLQGCQWATWRRPA